MIFCLVVEYALSSSIARLPAFDFCTTSCWSITATLNVSAENPGDTIASHNATAPITPVTLVRSIESSSAPYEYHPPGHPPNKLWQKPFASRARAPHARYQRDPKFDVRNSRHLEPPPSRPSREAAPPIPQYSNLRLSEALNCHCPVLRIFT